MTAMTGDGFRKIEVTPGSFSDAVEVATLSEIPQATTATTDSAPVSQPVSDQAAATEGVNTPASQIAPALVGVLTSTDGAQSVTVRLQPPELGRVEIRVDQTAAGAARVEITAEKPETLQLLQRDEPHLQQVLDQAGVSSGGRSFSFQVAAPEQVGASASRPDSMEAGPGDFGRGQSGGASHKNDNSQSGSGTNPNPEQRQARARWFRAGLDITA
jgi:flagellar hook-length control protein FliK